MSDSTGKYCNSPGAGTKRLSPVLASTPTSALTKHIQPMKIVSTPKTGNTRVLTSSECLNMLEEKRRNKQLKDAEKENRKKVREEKKKQRELEQLKKKEEQEKKKAEREKKKEEQKAAKEKKKAELEKRKAESERKKRGCKEKVSSQPKRRCQSSSPGECSNNLEEGSEVSESAATCAFCFEPYTTDGSEWVQCVCGRWVHELCIEDIHVDEAGKEKFCPFCINS